MRYDREIATLDAEVEEKDSILDAAFHRCVDGLIRVIWRCGAAVGAWVLCLDGGILVFGATSRWLLIPMGVLLALLVAFVRNQFRKVAPLVEEFFAAERPYFDALERRNKLLKAIDEQSRATPE